MFSRGFKNWVGGSLFCFLKELLLCRGNKCLIYNNSCGLPSSHNDTFENIGSLAYLLFTAEKACKIRIYICCFDVNAAV